MGLTSAGLAGAAGLAAGWCWRRWALRRRAWARLTADGHPGAAGGPTAPAWRSPAGVAAAGVATGAGIALVATAGAPVVVLVALVCAAAGLATPRVLRQRRRQVGSRRRRGQLPAALDRLATALRSGASVPLALTEAGGSLAPPLGPELAALGRQAAAGRAVVEVLDRWSARHDDTGTRLAATALALATTVGGAPGRAVDGVAATLRERLDLADERRALSSQARLSALVLALAPVGFAVVLGVTDGSVTRYLLGTPAGWACLTVGLSLDAAGTWWMARLTRGDRA